jgi:hypothetical protein
MILERLNLDSWQYEFASQDGDCLATNFNGLYIVRRADHFHRRLARTAQPVALFGDEYSPIDQLVMPQVGPHPAGG